jgi:hypothetical protein
LLLDDDYDPYWEDRDASKANKGVFANRIYVQPLGNGMVRINFGEVLDDQPTYHTAIVVTAEQAVGFAQVIYNIGAGVEEAERLAAEEAARASASPPPSIDTQPANNPGSNDGE